MSIIRITLLVFPILLLAASPAAALTCPNDSWSWKCATTCRLYLSGKWECPKVRPICAAITSLGNAITRYDVGEFTPQEGVKDWNAIIRAQKRVRQASGC